MSKTLTSAKPQPSSHLVQLSDMDVGALGVMANALDGARSKYESMSGTCGTLAGLVLIEAKKRLKHGEYLPWVAQHLGKSRERANQYVGVAKAFLKCQPKLTFDQMPLALMDRAPSQDLQVLDFENPLVSKVAKWTNGRSFYQLRQDELTQGGNHHPQCPHCQGDLKSKTQEICPHCGKSTGEEEKTTEDTIKELTEQTREWAHSQLTDANIERKLYRLLPDHEASALAAHYRDLARQLEEWVKTPARKREAMSLEEVLK